MYEKFFDPYANIHETIGNLPHWTQQGKITFITFRLADSIPQNIANEFIFEERTWREEHPNPINKELEKWHRERHNRLERYLDAGHGACVLANPACRDIMVRALEFMDGGRCIIHSYVIMPNHIHLLIEPNGEWTIQKIIGSVKMFTAKEINSLLGRTGRLWRKDYFDRIVRNEKNYIRVLGYIKANPLKMAGNRYTYYIREDLKDLV